MAVATAICPKCGFTNELQPCPNCGNGDFRKGNLTSGARAMICKRCNLGYEHLPCQGGCGTLIPTEALGTATSRMAEQLHRNLNQSPGESCFIATELYGNDSIEVAILRQFRDLYLLKNRLGAAFVSIYYKTAPRLVPVMRYCTPIKLATRSLVGMIVSIVRRLPMNK